MLGSVLVTFLITVKTPSLRQFIEKKAFILGIMAPEGLSVWPSLQGVDNGQWQRTAGRCWSVGTQSLI